MVHVILGTRCRLTHVQTERETHRFDMLNTVVLLHISFRVPHCPRSRARPIGHVEVGEDVRSSLLPHFCRAITAAAKVSKYSTAPMAMAKLPNILVLTRQTEVLENDSLFASTKEALTACLDKERYVVYPLGARDLFKAPWKENCSLLVVPTGTEPDVCSPAVLREVKSYL